MSAPPRKRRLSPQPRRSLELLRLLARACPQLGEIFTRTDQNQTRNAVL
jgi:hypothetical protein